MYKPKYFKKSVPPASITIVILNFKDEHNYTNVLEAKRRIQLKKLAPLLWEVVKNQIKDSDNYKWIHLSVATAPARTLLKYDPYEVALATIRKRNKKLTPEMRRYLAIKAWLEI